MSIRGCASGRLAAIRPRMLLPWRAWLLATLCLCSACTGAHAGGRANSSCAGAEQRLSLATPTLEQPVDAAAVASAPAFVQVVIAAVANPQRIPVSFVLRFHARDGKASYLGSFSLFPADNPGTFIVATGDKLEAGGRVSVTLVPLQPVLSTQVVDACVASVRFIR